MKYKMKLFVFIIEMVMILCIISMMIFTHIYNGSYFSIFHKFDKQKHLILKEKIDDNEFIFIYERGKPVFFERNHLVIRLSDRLNAIDIDVDNKGKMITKKNIDVMQKQDSIAIVIHKSDGRTIIYKLNEYDMDDIKSL